MHIKKKIFLDRAILFVGLILSVCQQTYAQKQYNIDSLETLYKKGENTTREYLKVLRLLTYNHPNLDQQLFYADELISKALEVDSMHYVRDGYAPKGYAQNFKGNLPKALENHYLGHKTKGSLQN